MKNVLIAGGSGMIGSELTKSLLAKGYEVSILSRSGKSTSNPSVKTYSWDPALGKIDPEAVQRADYIINLAGANIGEKHWSFEYKQEILNSRVDATRLLVEETNKRSTPLKAFYNASAIGIYGYNRDENLVEDSIQGNDFLAIVCQLWEEEASKLNSEKARLIIGRFGIVLSTKGGAFKEIVEPIKHYIGATLEDGHQLTSWIHIDDLVQSIIWSLENESVYGAYNIVASNPVSNKELTQVAAKSLHKPLWMPGIPKFMLRLLLGEFVESAVGSLNCSDSKLTQTGFAFTYPTIGPAVENLIRFHK